jgi:hypothetical protein
MTQNIIKTTMYDIVSNYASNIASFHWDIRDDEEYRDDFLAEDRFKEASKLVNKKTSLQTLRRLFNDGSTYMMLNSKDMNQLEAWERDNAQWLVFVYEGVKVDDDATPFAVLTKNEVAW